MSHDELKIRAVFLLYIVFQLYCWTILPAIIVYNWRAVSETSLTRWLLFGEIIPTAKGFIWPYFAFQSDTILRDNAPALTASRPPNPDSATLSTDVAVLPQKSPVSHPVTLCVDVTAFLSDGTSTTKVQTPDRWDHGDDELFRAMGYRIVPCGPEAKVQLHLKFISVMRPGKDVQVSLRILGREDARHGSFITTFAAGENEEKVEARMGFGIAKVMESLEPGFMKKALRMSGNK